MVHIPSIKTVTNVALNNRCVQKRNPEIIAATFAFWHDLQYLAPSLALGLLALLFGAEPTSMIPLSAGITVVLGLAFLIARTNQRIDELKG